MAYIPPKPQPVSLPQVQAMPTIRNNLNEEIKAGPGNGLDSLITVPLEPVCDLDEDIASELVQILFLVGLLPQNR